LKGNTPVSGTNLARLALGLACVIVGACSPPLARPGAEQDATMRSAGAVTAPAQRGVVRISAVGDIMLDGTARPVLQQFGYDYPFVQVRRYLRESNIVFGNLEGPLTDAGQPAPDKQYVFRSPPAKVVPALKAAGFNVVSLANNHIMDYGAVGLAQTIKSLDADGIRHVGAGADLAAARQPAIFEINGLRIAFLAYSLTHPDSFYADNRLPGTAFGHEDQVRADVAAAHKRVDIVLVSFHWGQEGTTTLREYQIRLGHAAIDAGAEVVIGHHPHIVQGIERYKHGVILYSLGNFTFGSYSKDAQYSVIAQLDFRGRQSLSLRLVPINVNNIAVQFQPQLLTGADAGAVVRELQRLSLALDTTLKNENNVATLDIVPNVAAR